MASASVALAVLDGRLAHAIGGATPEIPELFVWPTFRRMGIARHLEEVASEYASAWRCKEIHLMMNEGQRRAVAATSVRAMRIASGASGSNCSFVYEPLFGRIPMGQIHKGNRWHRYF